MDLALDKGEVPFSFDELFFSRTDARGIILSGNSVFQRISQYGWDELIKKPHNIIRHPDMPKGVFYLLWDFLKRGEPIAAYVKNRARDGRYYWVFAIATPVEGGYLSVRLKPSSDFFPLIQSAYKDFLGFETGEKADAKAGAEKILEVLSSLGFNTYQEFMSTAIRKEIEARDVALGNRVDASLACFKELTERASCLLKETSNIFLSYEANQYVPLNLQIHAAQLGEEGRSIGVISGNFSIVSNEIREEIEIFNKSAREVFDKIFEGQFLVCVARMQREVCDYFKKESVQDNQIDNAGEIKLLSQQQEQYHKKAVMVLRDISRSIARFQEDCRRMKRCVASLEVIRLMGKVDASRLSVYRSGLNELIDDLKEFQTLISNSMVMIEQHNASMRYGADATLSAIQSVA